MSYIIKPILSLIFSALITIFPGSGFLNDGAKMLKLTPKNDNVLLNVSMISDIHLDNSISLGDSIFEIALRDIEKGENIDAVLVSGDLTNYGDGPSIEGFFKLMQKDLTNKAWIVASGNHDIGHVEDTTEDGARERFVNLYNQYTGGEIENVYYSMDVNGYRFVILGDEGDDTWDHPEYSDEQIAFLDNALAEASGRGLPMFVVSHVPVEGANGQSEVWEDGGLRDYSDAVKNILEKYDNVFFISGHLHVAINGELTQSAFGFACVETTNGVTYVNLPTYMIVNRYGIPWGGMGFQMEVYENEVLFRARNYATSKWYPSYDYTVPIA